MKAPVLVTIVVFLHAMVIGTLVFVQGCGTPQPKVEPPPAPVLPPPAAPEKPSILPPARPVEVRPALPALPAKPLLPKAPEAAPQEYVIQTGDSLSVVAHRHGLKTSELAAVNGITDLNKVRVGQKILIPASGTSMHAAAPVKKPAKPAAPTALTGSEYVVQAGDYLGKIAQKYGVRTAAIREANNLTSDVLRPGQKLVLPAGAAKKGETDKPKSSDAAPDKAVEGPAVPPMPGPAVEIAPPPVPAVPVAPGAPVPAGPVAVTPVPAVPAVPAAPSLTTSHQPIKYPVGQGETIESIAKAFLVTPEALRKLNSLSETATVKPGTTILIPVPE